MTRTHHFFAKYGLLILACLGMIILIGLLMGGWTLYVWYDALQSGVAPWQHHAEPWTN